MPSNEPLAFTAVVRPQKAEALVRALLACEGISACHAVEVRGSGNQRPIGNEAVFGFLPKVAIHGLVDPGALPAVEQLVRSVCPTGRSGDGKLFVQQVLRCFNLDPHADEEA
jgi:nitrogen regulatory protein P-II 1